MSLTRSLTRPLAGRITRALNSASAGGGGTPPDPLLEAALALNPVWLYDHKDLSSFFEDSAMTTPATVGGVVGAVLDKSVNARHRIQTTTASKPILRQAGGLYYLEYDGVDDFMQTAAINLTATDAMTLCLGIRSLSDAATAVVCEFSASSAANNGTFALFKPLSGGTSNLSSLSKGTTQVVPSYTNAAVASPRTMVITLVNKISTPSAVLRLDGTAVSTQGGTQGTGNYGNHVLYFGRRGGSSLPANMYDYGGALYATNYSGANLDAIEDFVADRTGVAI